MKVLITSAVVIGLTAGGPVPGVAQTTAPTMFGIPSTSPLNTGIANTTGIEPSPTSGSAAVANSPPCSSSSVNSSLPTFDGGGINFGSIGSGSSLGAQSSASSPCNATNTENTAITTASGLTIPPSTNSSTVNQTVSPSTTAMTSSTASASPSTTSNTGLAGLGTSGLGAVGLGTASLSSQSSSQTSSASTGVAGSSTYCSAGSSTSASSTMGTSSTNMSMTVGDAGSLSGMTIALPQGTDASGLVRNPAAGVVSSGPYDPAETLAGTARVPTMNAAGAPCLVGE